MSAVTESSAFNSDMASLESKVTVLAESLSSEGFSFRSRPPTSGIDITATAVAATCSKEATVSKVWYILFALFTLVQNRSNRS